MSPNRRRGRRLPSAALLLTGGLLTACGPPIVHEQPNLRPPPVDASADLTPACDEGLCGYLDGSGRLAIPRRFRLAKPFYEGRASVLIAGRGWGVIDPAGQFVAPPGYASIGPFSEGLAAAQPSARDLYHWAYIDPSGATAIDLKFHVQAAWPFHGGRAWITIPYWFVSRDEVIDRTGKVIGAAPVR
jgi:hypothetical protein